MSNGEKIIIQKNNTNHDTPTVCLTANAISGAGEYYMTAGFDDYLTKPIDAEQLEEMLMKYLPDEKVEESLEDDAVEQTDDTLKLQLLDPLKDEEWIDIDTGIAYSGNIDSYMPLLKIFYTTLEDKANEIEGFYSEDDIRNYTIRVHALKSSARIIGAMEFGEEAQQLEDAGKREDITYIKEHHDHFMQTFLSFKAPLSEVFKESETDKPEADKELMKDVLEEIKAAADDMDCDRIEAVFSEMKDYSIPSEYKDLWNTVNEAATQFDYEKIVECIEKKN